MGYLQTVPARIKFWLANKLERKTTGLYAWIVMQKLSDGSGYITRADNPLVISVPDPAKLQVARRIVEQELAEILKTAERYVGNYLEEKQIVHERLARRYDPGLALNEAFERSMAKVASAAPGEFVKVELRPGETIAQAQQRMVGGEQAGPIPAGMGSLELSPNQQAALKHQEEFLRKNAATPPRPLGS